MQALPQGELVDTRYRGADVPGVVGDRAAADLEITVVVGTEVDGVEAVLRHVQVAVMPAPAEVVAVEDVVLDETPLLASAAACCPGVTSF